jgi:deazaflavin-dependent oxidoreductase (nitroreductase family)
MARSAVGGSTFVHGFSPAWACSSRASCRSDRHASTNKDCRRPGRGVPTVERHLANIYAGSTPVARPTPPSSPSAPSRPPAPSSAHDDRLCPQGRPALDFAKPVAVPGPRWLARFNRRVTNRVALPLARWLPNFGVVRHTGRRSGRAYRTPIMVFRTSGHRFVVALTYGPQTEWVQNVLQSGACRLEYHGRILCAGRPPDPRRASGPPPWVVCAHAAEGERFPGLSVADPASRRTQQPLDVGGKP